MYYLQAKWSQDCMIKTRIQQKDIGKKFALLESFDEQAIRAIKVGI